LLVRRKRKKQDSAIDQPGRSAEAGEADVRIIGGEFRGRRLRYQGDRSVRPMKHRTREAIFNLIGTQCAGRDAIDLFAGTGALGLEAVSRGALSATLIERHVPTARIIRENIRTLGVEDRATLLVTSAFLWAKRDLGSRHGAEEGDRPWLVFCSPPYAFYHERRADMVDLIRRIQHQAPAGSILIVEAEEPFDFELLDGAETGSEVARWDVRSYPPAVVGIWRAK
jgi:16S rRNA (guanine966-N2)-methyltransferase